MRNRAHLLTSQDELKDVAVLLRSPLFGLCRHHEGDGRARV